MQIWSWCVGVGAVVGAVAAARSTARAQTSAADAVVPAAFAMPLTSPSAPNLTADVVQRVLAAARVPFGVEEAPRQSPPLIDLAHPPSEVANLHAMTVRTALNTIARVDSAVRWTEQDGVIVVRLTSGPTWLDKALPPFKATNVDLSKALDALVTALDPRRAGQVEPAGTNIVRIGPDGKEIAVGADLPRFSVSRGEGTVLDGLNAIVRVTHTSWRVDYIGQATDADSASIVIGNTSRFRTGQSASTYRVTAPTAVESRTHRDPNLVTVPIALDLSQAAVTYAQAAGVTVGMESLAPPEEVVPTGVTLELNRTEPREALERIVAYDSRYELSEERGVFHIRPRDQLVLSGYAAPVSSFSASNEAVGDVMGRIVALAGGVSDIQRRFPPIISVQPGNTGSQAGNDRQRHDAPLTPVSFDFAGPGTVRDVLDALCADRKLSWVVRPTPRVGAGDWTTLMLASSDGWTITRSAVMPSLQPAVRLAAPPPNTVAAPQTLEMLYEELPNAMSSRQPFGAYLYETAQTPGERAASAATAARAPRILLRGSTTPDVLARLLEGLPSYAWTDDRGIYHIQPLTPSPGEPINKPVDRLDIQVDDLDHAASAILAVITQRPVESTPPNVSQPLGRPGRLVLAHGSVRDALDALLLARQAGSWTLVWSNSGQFQSIRLRLCALSERVCTIVEQPMR